LRIRIGSGLLWINLLVIALIVVVSLSSLDPFRIILGLPFALFFPGYVLVLALFPRKDSLDGIARLALSFVFSIAVVSLIGLGLNYTEWGITLESTLYSLSCFILILSAVSRVRLMKLSKEERFDLDFKLGAPVSGSSAWGRVLSVILIISILGAIGMLGYVIANPKMGEKFTEFYVLGLNGMATDYPTEFVVEDGQVISVKYGSNGNNTIEEQYGRVTLGIVNREQQTATYSIEILINGNPVDILYEGLFIEGINSITLEHDEKWEQEIGFAPLSVGQDQKVEFLLYKNNLLYFEDPLHIWIDVNNP